MIFKSSIVHNTDRCGAGFLRILHTYSKLKRRFARIGSYTKASVRTIEKWPARIRGKRYRPIRVGFVLRNYYNLGVRNSWMGCSMTMGYSVNSCIILRRRGMLKSAFVLGPCFRPTKIKKYFYTFDNIL